MTNREIIAALREAANQKKMEYVVHSVREKLARNTLKESLFRGNPLNEDIRDVGSAYERRRTPFDAANTTVGAPKLTGYPAIDRVEFEAEALLSGGKKGLDASDEIAKFFVGTGAGTYRRLLADLISARSAAAKAKDSAMTAEDLIDAFQRLYPSFSPEDQRKIRGAARKYLLGFKRGF
jgi:hypothetical protein